MANWVKRAGYVFGVVELVVDDYGFDDDEHAVRDWDVGEIVDCPFGFVD
jgi:hypothetical protein